MAELTGGGGRARSRPPAVLLLPLGSHEEQGPHAPMGDFLLADRMAELIAARAHASAGTETLVAPVLPFGGADISAVSPAASRSRRRRCGRC